MGSEDRSLVEDLAYANVNGATGAANFAIGCTTSRSGVGVYPITIAAVSPDRGQQVAANRLTCNVMPVGTANARIPMIEQTSDLVKTVRLFSDTGVAADGDFIVEIGVVVNPV
jgi:hypothetical protein